MTDAQVIGFTILLPIMLVWVFVMLRSSVDKQRDDWVARRHRKISHRGFKSRAGMRS